MTNHKRTLLVIEDWDDTFVGLKARFESGDRWRVERAKNRFEALARLERGPVDAVTLDPGLPPSTNNPLTVGLPLATELRRLYPKLPIMLVSNLGISDDESERLIAGLLPLGISAVYVRQSSTTLDLANLLELVWQGYFILSPGAADELPDVVADRPDPLEKKYWDVIRPLAQGKSYEQIAAEVQMKKNGVEGRRNRAIAKLIELGELEDYQADTESLRHWYVKYCVRFRRERPGPFPQARADSI